MMRLALLRTFLLAPGIVCALCGCGSAAENEPDYSSRRMLKGIIEEEQLAQNDSDDQASANTGEPAGESSKTNGLRSTADSDVTGPAKESKDERNIGVLITSLTIFVLAIFVGFEVITKVPPTLHTPLMSGSNAISGITIVGAVIAAGIGTVFDSLIGMLAVALAAVNVVGGFMVTHRMLQMFRKK